MKSNPIRERSFEYLEQKGFRPAKWLPIERSITQLRPLDEIAARLMALDCLFTWVSFPEAEVASSRIEAYRDRNALTTFLTDDENAILSVDRSSAREKHIDNIGWKLENMWPLAWVLGFEPEPDIDSGMISGDIIRKMILEFMPGLNATVQDLCKKANPRTTDHVVALEDRFYCAHNAVRSAQLGHSTVPSGFNPVADGGTVHERRHALTWCLSPAVEWGDADLST